MAKRRDEWDPENDWQTMASQMAPGMAPATSTAPNYYLPGMPVPETPPASQGAPATTLTPFPGTRQAWGFTSPSGGKGTYGYTPGQYEGEIANYSGFNPEKLSLDHPDADSMKYVFLRATQGIQPTVENLDEIVRRLNAQGIPAKRDGYDRIDFGLGEGPIDVVNQTRGGVWDWQGPDTGGADPMAAQMASQATGQPASAATGPGTQGGSDMWQLIMQDLQRVAAGQPSQLDLSALLGLMGGSR